MKTEHKITISRSFSRTYQIENFEPAQFFSSRNMEIPADTPMEEQQEISKELFSLVMMDVSNARQDYDAMRESTIKGKGVDPKTFREMQDRTGRGLSVNIGDFEGCSQEQRNILNEFKKYYKRGPEAKAKREER